MLVKSPSRTLYFFFFGIHIILMGILGVVVVLDEVELDVVLETHLTKAFGASSMHQSPLEACPNLCACGIVVKDHLEPMSP